MYTPYTICVEDKSLGESIKGNVVLWRNMGGGYKSPYKGW